MGKLNTLSKGTIVSLETLKKYRIISKDISSVKLLGGGELTVALTVKLPCSSSAKEVIIKAGGSVE